MKRIIFLLLLLFCELGIAQTSTILPQLSTPVTTMTPNRRIYVNNQWPRKDYRHLGRSTSEVLELAPAGSTTPGRWPGFAFGTNGRNMGGFRIFSYESHFSLDDPIVYPGQGGRSHCHIFFGNSNTSGVSTATSIRTTGNSTSAGGTANRSAYWVPCMVYVCDSLAKIALGCSFARNGEVIRPESASGLNVYYKSHFGEELITAGKPNAYWLFNHDTQALPTGFRMIAGCSTCTANNPATGANDLGNSFTCEASNGDDGGVQKWIPGTGGKADCGASYSYAIKQIVRFPSCWNNTDLDSPTHNTHIVGPSTSSDASYTMLDSEDWFCPAAYPIPFPGVTYKLHYLHPGSEIQFWRLSSDNYDTSQPAGYSNHGDWFNGWDSTIMAEWVANCMVLGTDCHDNVLGPAVITSGYWRVLKAPLGIPQ